MPLKKFVLPIAFCFIIMAPAIDLVFNISPSHNINENRNKAPLPKWSATGPETFPLAFENYFSDNFNLRSDLLIANAYIKFNILGISPFKEQVLIGRNQWLFHMKYIPVYQAKSYFDAEEHLHFNQLFALRKKWLDARGIKMYLAVVPVSTSVYPEYLPSFMVKYHAKNRTDSLISYLRKYGNCNIIDLREILLQEKANGALRMYHKTDQHWNDYGAMLATKAIIDTLRMDFKDLEPLQRNAFVVDSQVTKGRGLAGLLLKENEIMETCINATPIHGFKAVPVPEKKFDVPADFPYKDQFELRFTSPKGRAPKIMVLRDSYASNLMTYMNEYFRESLYIWDNWAYRLNETIVEAEKPDIVLFEVIEADLYNMIYGSDTEIGRDTIARFRYTNNWATDTSMVKKSAGMHASFY